MATRIICKYFMVNAEWHHFASLSWTVPEKNMSKVSAQFL